MTNRVWLAFASLCTCLMLSASALAQTNQAPPTVAPSTVAAPPQRPWVSETEQEEIEKGERAETSFHLELGGVAVIWSLNVDVVIENVIALRIGGSLFPLDDGETLLGLPVSLSYVGIRWLELGSGASLLYASGRDSEGSWSNTQGVVSAFGGVRVQPQHGGFQFRGGLMAMFAGGRAFKGDDDGPPPRIFVFPSAYLSFGVGL